jgi:AcrR family transcriptional regulator
LGRHKEFCVEWALERALEVFWRHGYEGASLTDLTAAMGISRPSLYAAYGNKETLFRKALDLYDTRYMGFAFAALEAPRARDVVAQVLAGFVELAAGDDTPPGCMGTQGALVCSTAAEPIKEELIRRRTAFEALLARRLQRAQDEGDLASDDNPSDLARFVMTFSGGIAIQAAGGASRAALRRAADVALRAWPAVPEMA